MQPISEYPSCLGQILHCTDKPHFSYPFIHQRILGCFHVLAIVSNTATSMVCTHLETLPSVLRATCSEVEQLDYTTILLTVILRNHHTISIAVVSCDIPTNIAQEFQFLHILTSTCFLCSNSSQRNGCEVVLRCSLNWDFPNN